MISFLHFLQGYYKLFVCGCCPERFLNLCTNKGILLWKLRAKKGGYEFFISRKAYKSLLSLREKTNTTIEVEGKYGLPFFLYRYRKRKFFFFGMCGCVAVIYFLSLFIWDIQIVGTVHYTEEEIEKYLLRKEIHTGIYKKNLDCTGLEEEIREDFSDAAWVSCDIEGTRFRVQLKESIDGAKSTEAAENDATPKDIVASKNGTIISIITRNGTPLVKKKDVVKKGDTLISGIIYIYNEYDELLETNVVRADGDIKAQTVYEYKDIFSLSYYEKSYTGAKKEGVRLYFGDYSIPLFLAKNSYENYDETTEYHQLKLGHAVYLPFAFEIIKAKEYLPVKKTYQKEEAKKKARKKLDHYLQDLKENNIEIVKEDITVKVTAEECVAKGTITVVESIGKIRNIK
ncbi:MAG: sporulation protein YqfD [Lachnospiraceae bacterium]|nr:sporulation protein YqfD [Lachnospiraceae bacterium]